LSDAAFRRAAEKSSTYREFVAALYSEYASSQGKPLAGEKTPDYVKQIPLLIALFPATRVIHIVRDGRDVALSLLEWANETKGPGKFDLWRSEPIAVCALWWRWQVSSGRAAGQNSSLYFEIGYEDLVAHSHDRLQELAAFLDLPFASEMLAYHEGKVRSAPGLSAKSAWLPPTSGLRDWRTQMATRDVELFEALAGDLLAELGYERSVATISPETAALAERYSREWRSTIEQRHRSLAESR
jgi:hypothetical protein